MMDSIGINEISSMVADRVECDRKHVLPVLKLLLEEMLSMVIDGDTVDVGGFGVLSMTKMLDTNHASIGFRDSPVFLTDRKTLRFRLEKELQNFLLGHLAKKKTYGSRLDNVE